MSEDNRNWRFFRRRNGGLGFRQRIYEALLVLTGKHSLHRAWQLGLDYGIALEYRRLITNKAYIAEAKAPEQPHQTRPEQ